MLVADRGPWKIDFPAISGAELQHLPRSRTAAHKNGETCTHRHPASRGCACRAPALALRRGARKPKTPALRRPPCSPVALACLRPLFGVGGSCGGVARVALRRHRRLPEGGAGARPLSLSPTRPRAILEPTKYFLPPEAMDLAPNLEEVVAAARRTASRVCSSWASAAWEELPHPRAARAHRRRAAKRWRGGRRRRRPATSSPTASSARARCRRWRAPTRRRARTRVRLRRRRLRLRARAPTRRCRSAARAASPGATAGAAPAQRPLRRGARRGGRRRA